ncbi:MAG TPA: polysaccharide biosynthesis protein [Firmicutes bacterium]|nr:polysaccharide biosynthesis protein [Bacillota bacterium]
MIPGGDAVVKRVLRTLVLALADALVVNLALLCSLWLRFDGYIPLSFLRTGWRLAPWVTGIYLFSFYLFGLYRRLWRYASVGDLVAIALSALAGGAVTASLTLFLMVERSFLLPRSVLAFWPVLVVAFVGAVRLLIRLAYEYRLPAVRVEKGKAVLIVGAGDAGAAVVREFRNHDRIPGNGADMRPIGFVDDDPAKQGQHLLGFPVLGRRKDIPDLVRAYGVAEIIIAMPSVRGKAIKEIVEICRGTGAKLRIIPGMYDLMEGKVRVDPIRPVQVEDILGREPVKVDVPSIAGYLAGQTVLVTGAGGSIGSELCRQVARVRPRLLVLLGHGENSIYQIHQELSGRYPELALARVIADVKDEAAVGDVFRTYAPGVVFHAAAHKHVPLMELNPAEALRNNVLGTRVVAEAAARYGAHTFVLISTDKAVNPTSIMGASKRVAEAVVQSLGRGSKTRFAAVRFGNVLGSRGSVVPLFQRQIAAGGPVTVTHPEMVRYFMTIPEAVQLVIQAGALAKGGEVFVLDMGEPVKIVDLARNMIELSGYKPGVDMDIVFTGIRPGEKLYEEILTAGEGITATSHERIFIARPEEVAEDKLAGVLRTISEPGWHAGRAEVEELLRGLLPEFRPGGADGVGGMEAAYEEACAAEEPALGQKESPALT